MANGRGVRPKVCKVCGIAGTDDAPISFRGLCRDDAIARAVANNRAMANRSGPEYERWRQRMRETWAGDRP